MPSQTTPNTYHDARSVEINRECVENGRLLGTVTISNAAQEQGATLQWFTGRDVWAVLTDRRVAITGHHGTESALASGIESDKLLAQELMRDAGIPVPAGRRAYSADDAIQAQQEIGRPIVIKPVNGSMGKGVTVNVSTADDIRAGFSRAAGSGARVLVEQYIEGSSEYRAHATSTECAAVFRRLLPSITGDGESTVAELIEQKNALRRYNPSTRPNPIPVDDVAAGFLRRRGLTWNSVVPEGDHVVVRDVNGITSGGDSEECWDSVSESIKQVAVGAVAAIPGMEWGGVDILVEDMTGIPYVIEVNTNAAINGSTFPVFGTPRDLGSVLWRQLYAHSYPEPSQDPTTPKRLDVPIRLEALSLAADKREWTLKDILVKHLEGQGHRITYHNQRIWSAERSGAPSLWFDTVLSEKDPATAIRPIRRLLLLRRILRAVGIARPAGRQITRIEQLEAFREKVGTPVTLMPARKSLGRATSKSLETADLIDGSVLDGRRNWFVQTQHPGLRFSVTATPHEALAIVASSDQVEPSDEIIESISTLAVSAVRAVPHLRWAVVDIVQPSRIQGTDSQPVPLVEGFSLNPTFNSSNEVIAGSIEKVIEVIVSM